MTSAMQKIKSIWGSPKKKQKIDDNLSQSDIFSQTSTNNKKTHKHPPDDDNKDFEIDGGNHEVDDMDNDNDEFEDGGDQNEEFEDYEFDSNDDGGDDWGDDDDLCYDDQKQIDITKEEDCEQMLKRAMEKRRLANAKLSSFWKCGKCEFLNHPSRAVCMQCAMPQLDVVHHIMMCPKNELKVCPRCKAYVVPHLYDDHVLDCNPIGALDNESTNQAWFVKLTDCEQKAINHVNGLAIKKSEDEKHKKMLISLVEKVENGKYKDTVHETIKALHHFLEWECPIIIKIHIADLIPKIMKDTHYRNLFEIGTGSGGNDLNIRRTEEGKMFGPVYDKAKAFERPKYGCLNIGLTERGNQQANTYGDGYFLMNDTTVRWRTTMTVQDSFQVQGDCGTVKHCNHLLTQLMPNELQEIIEAALTKKVSTGGANQRAYREIQIHGPVQLNRDIISVHVPSHHRTNAKLAKTLEEFCAKNMCKLKYFDAKQNVNGTWNSNMLSH